MRFVKMEGAGNDFVCVDGRHGGAPSDPARVARRICDRRRGVGADGLVVLTADPGAHARMVVWNADGSRAGMCGNALRCVGRLLSGGREAVLRVRTDAGVLRVEEVEAGSEVSTVRTAVGRPDLERSAIPMLGPPGPVLDEELDVGARSLRVCALRLGNPHCVVWTEDLEADDLERLGREVSGHGAFPERANAVFVRVDTGGRLLQRTWERGCGETPCCGTGAAAACVAGVVTGRTRRRVRVACRGGELELDWPSDDEDVIVSGPATTVFAGTWSWR